MTKRVNVLGTVYSVQVLPPELDDELEHSSAYVNFNTKVMVIRSTLPKSEKKRALLHEIIHAFFYESGLECYSSDETLVGFLELQLSKLVTLCNKQNIF